MSLQWTNHGGEAVCRALEVDPSQGLTAAEAVTRRKRHGENTIDRGSRVSALAIFLNQFKDFMVLVLLGATFLSALLGEYTDAITILIIVVCNAFMGLIQEYRAERSLEVLQKMTAPRVTVRREGTLTTVPTREVVPGDICLLQAGDLVGADIRLLSVQALAVNEAALTGESVTVDKEVSLLPDPVSSPGDALNMAFSGTTVVAGRALGVVVATAMNTQLGQIAHLISRMTPPPTPLQQRLSSLGRLLILFCLVICAAVIFLGCRRGEPVYQMFMSGVSLAVAAIPEGLPAIVTISLALGVQRMIRRRAIVRRLPTVETLGSASVICSDKTGTLTQNRMSLEQLYGGGNLYKVEGGRYRRWQGRTWGELRPGDPLTRLALTIAAGCNNAYYEDGSFHGDPTEVGLAEAAREAGIKIFSRERILEIPFTSERKMMSVVWGGERRRLLVKGAPETLLARCRYRWSEGKVLPLTARDRREIMANLEEMASHSLRSLAVAYRNLDNPGRPGPRPAASPPQFPSTQSAPTPAPAPTPEQLERELVWVALLGLEDPPRPEARPAIRLCRRAGIRVIMITGDHRATAVSIALRLGIMESGASLQEGVLTGNQLEAMGDQELLKVIGRIAVFARVSPTHKLRIVRALRKRGGVVAMTGDGVNDAPAIKEADIGIAMGRSGTDVAREAADLVLSDDNFSTIVSAIEEGRHIYNNIRKFIRFLLGCNLGEILTMLLAILLNLPLPLRPIQILWINLVTDGFPALALGVDRPEPGLMQHPPRRREEGVFGGGLWARLAIRGWFISLVTILVFSYGLRGGGDILRAQTMAFATLIISQLVYVFECRSGEGRLLWDNTQPIPWPLPAAVASSFFLMCLVIYLPALNPIFYTVPLSLTDWQPVLGAGLLPTLVDQLCLLLERGLKGRKFRYKGSPTR
ncbi:MAG: cation-translocating P-type ATPase [Firmicutes bacterium]|nr:cation-translocating P-type ATPase [Bacillota bacterium]